MKNKKVKKIRAVLTLEMEIDVSEFDEKYVKIEELALDLMKREIDDNLIRHEVTAKDFEYYHITESDSDANKAFYDISLAAKNAADSFQKIFNRAYGEASGLDEDTAKNAKAEVSE